MLLMTKFWSKASEPIVTWLLMELLFRDSNPGAADTLRLTAMVCAARPTALAVMVALRSGCG